MTAPCPVCHPIECDSTPDTALYSLETGIFPFVLNCPPGFSCQGIGTFQMVCCNQVISVVIPANASGAEQLALISGVVNQCAALLPFCGGGTPCATPPCPPVQIYQNSPQTCSVPCPDGAEFTYTVPAGTFGVAAVGSVSASAAINAANAQALAMACQQAGLRLLCLGPLQCSGCKGQAFSTVIGTTGGVGPFTWSSSTLPAGLSLDPNSGTISGVPTAFGTFSFTITVTEAGGGSVSKTYSLLILGITTTVLPPFVVGSPYAFQLQASGGSGNYAWKVFSGALPSGLTLSVSGLISGIPTGASGGGAIGFEVIDQVCEVADPSFFPASISLSARSTTQIATLYGWSEFPGFTSSPPKKFKTVTWSGSSEQQLWYQGVQIGGARLDFASQDQIDELGNVTSRHTKNLSLMCNGAQNRANIVGPPYPQNTNYSLAAGFLGYFGTNNTFYSNPFGPTELCSSSSIPYTGVGNVAGNSPFQYPASDLVGLWGTTPVGGQNSAFINGATVVFQSNSSAISNDNGTTNVIINPYALPLLPPGVILESFSQLQTSQGNVPRPPDWGAGAQVIFTNSFSATLEDEYTDSEALMNALTILGNGTTAENSVRTTGFVSRFTNVVFTLTSVNLINGQNYTISVDFSDITAGTVTTKQYSIIGSTADVTVTDTVPTPPPGHFVVVRNPRITFS